MLNQNTYWNKVADKKQFTTPFDIGLFEKYVKGNSKILDYGCGYGRTLVELKENGYMNLSGVDFSEEMIKRARSEDRSIDYRVVKNNQLPFEDDKYDAVLLFAVLTCVINNEEQTKIINEIRRVLKPEGIIYINDFLLNEDTRNLERYEKYRKKYGCYGVFELEEGAILRHFEEKRIEELTTYFETMKYEKVVYTTMNGNKSNGFNYIGRVNK